MKTPCPASFVLRSLALSWGIAVALLLTVAPPAYAQPAPPGYPGAGYQQPSTRATRQSAAEIQAPVGRPQNPGTYPPPPGYTYPPGYGTAPKASTSKTSTRKPATSSKSSTKKTAAKKPTAGPPPRPKVYGPPGDLTSQGTQIRDSDQVQNIRIGELERDVSSIKRSGKSSTRYDGGTDLAAHTTYIARPGDTLWHIASTHRVSVGEIQQLNRMTEEDVHVGQTLLIPSPHRLSSPTTQVSYTPSTPGGGSYSAPTSTVQVSSPVYYTVKKGDSLKAIALKHKLTAVTLASANKIKNVNMIIVGQRLKIPGRTTTVTVASKTKPAPRAESSDTIPLPGYGTPSAPPPSPSAAFAAPAPMPTAPPPAPVVVAAAPKGPDTSDSHRGILAYRVDSADSIESIATQFTTTPEQIREMNRLNPGSTLKVGDEIMVPAMGAVSVSSR
ncbi:LysM peptidoglycan-binding domain-containing protein [Prosthecobacter sp.]|uniref:LysM peptidoglycan-binding domain-containing protein n=1 Tax=Prosthecobacter sp. TaxID=1965333 RepID=UPI0024889DE6|nr:LysM peptidoglycan-binding domain-containing protein [Prosthecobacter sp.]MDI1313367.1 LysM peptidoglycan-binding domain-containing protein [Prosthecobacter sp.]